jgi:DNA-binding protein HU-beta
MTKSELVKAVAESTELPQTKVNAVIESMFEVITEQVRGGNKVQLSGLVSFQATDVAARNGVNPKTKEKIVIPARRVVRAKLGKTLRNSCAVTQ